MFIHRSYSFFSSANLGVSSQNNFFINLPIAIFERKQKTLLSKTMNIAKSCVYLITMLICPSNAIMRYQTNDPPPAFAHRIGHQEQQKETIAANDQKQTISSAEDMFTPFEMTWQQGVADRLRRQLQMKRATDDSSPLMVSLVGVPGSG